jgi:hypothetical protein
MSSTLLLVQLEELHPQTLRQTVNPLLMLPLALQVTDKVRTQQHLTKHCHERPKSRKRDEVNQKDGQPKYNRNKLTEPKDHHVER